jgi:ribonucleotide reductase beta subunit family protein with ferritin-like domain
LDTEEFYNSYLDDPTLKDRMGWIGRRVTKIDTHYDRLKSIAIFSMIEGAILYSSFAFIKHFQNQGKNKLININAGINFSAQDEDIHSQGGAWLYNQYLRELCAEEPYTDSIDRPMLESELVDTAIIIYEHESQINKKIFERGAITGITANQLDNFIKSRLDMCLGRIGIHSIFNPEYNPIASWFYNNLNSSILHDFFVKQGSDYNRNWNEKRFTWK